MSSDALPSYSMSLSALLAVFALDAKALNEKALDAELEVTSITLDSRTVTPGSAFFACKGHASDGRDYMLAAQNAGAIAIIYEAQDASLPDGLTVPTFAVHGLSAMVGYAASAFYREPSQELQVFGVTGTNGKTTCCYLLVQALTQLGMKAAMIGTIGVGTIDDLSGSGLTTPDAISVQAALAKFRDAGVTQVAMEVSSHALDQGRVNGVEFFCTLFTNLSHDHLDYHGDMASYGLAKQRLFTDFHSELVITNAADELGSRLIDVATADFIVQYGQGGDVFADDVKLGVAGIKMTIEGNGVEFEITTPLIGKVNIQNIEMLVATLLALSTSIEEIQGVLANISPAPGRMELYQAPGKPKLVVDYAHTPDALEKALLSVAEHCAGTLWCVFGCGGDRDPAKRPEMGRLAGRHASKCIVTNDNPRTENPQAIADDIVAGMSSTEVEVILDRAAAIATAVNTADENDWVLVAGKGHEATQTIGTDTVPFSDREQALLALGLDEITSNKSNSEVSA